jgi:hypothetical protein
MDGIEDLERWAADARARDAADARVRERWLRAQAEEEASLGGALLACAEREEAVVLTGVDGRRHRGVVAGVGLDFCAVVSPSGTTTLVCLETLAELRPVDPAGRRRAPAAGDGHGRASLGVRLADVLAQAAGQRPRIAVQAGAASVVGDLRAVGTDLLTVRTDGTAGVAYVRLASVSDVSFLASG